MYKIIETQVLSDIIKLMVVEAPQVARAAKAGQFVIVRSHDRGERIPLTIADYDRAAGTITLIFQEVGKSTMEMGRMKAGEAFATVAGPLGHPTEIENYGTVACVGGGVGIAPIYPIARALKDAGNQVISVIGARNQGLLFWEDKMRAVSDELMVCTDDGSYGRKALTPNALKDVLAERQVARVWAIGPAIMMKFASLAAREYGVPCTVSLNTVMIDGTGMCGGCRVLLDDGAQFVCVDGPEFDGHKVDWTTLLSRLAYYRPEEQQAVQHWRDHECNLDKAAAAAEAEVTNG